MNSASTQFVPCTAGEEADWEMGNPLTFHSYLSARYGRSRWAY